MKTPTQFANWLDEQTARLEATRQEEGDEPSSRTFVVCEGIIEDAALYASRFGCDSFRKPMRTNALDALTVLGKYRTWITPRLPQPDLTVEDAAEKLGVSTQTIRAMVKDGRITHHRVGRQIRIRPEDCVMREKSQPSKYHLLDQHVKRRQSRGNKPSQAS